MTLSLEVPALAFSCLSSLLTTLAGNPIEIGCTNSCPFGDASLLLDKLQSIVSLLVGKNYNKVVLL
jgi:hypothetical protein